jgi:Dyp-type peroxidase family
VNPTVTAPLTGHAAAGAERLDLDDIQGLVVRGYGRLPHAAYLLLRISEPTAARSQVLRWAESEVTPASRSPVDRAVQVALTSTGVAALTGRAAFDQGFSEPFSTGMVTPYRSRLLGDVGPNDPARWAWGGPGSGAVDVALLLYADTASRLAELQSATSAAATDGGFDVVAQLATAELSDREHFGFHDGISQPHISGVRDDAAGGSSDDGVVRPGEFVLGYINEYDQRTERPLLPPALDPAGLLPRDPDGSGAADLGRNGSYLVFRQLSQDVAAFDDFLDRYATVGDGVDVSRRESLAAKVVGRWRGSGAPLALAPLADDPTLAKANDFGYHHTDPEGMGCPIGAHIRRANPRDALPPQPGTAASRAVNVRHRLLRRGRGYGPPASDDGERGLHFLCLGTNLARQYEFVQHSWINDPSFNGLVGTEDPLVGPRVAGPASFTEPAEQVRRRVTGLSQFVQPRGGAYFFLPGLRALRYLASVPLPDP